jgi:Flp pilus assembly protein TadG
MRLPTRKPPPRAREGAATVELALLLPFLCFLMVIAIDYARVFYFAVTVQNCARNGAYYASNYPNNNRLYNDVYGYTNLNDAVLRDASNLSPAPTYTVRYAVSANGPFTLTEEPTAGGYVQVTVNWQFQSITRFPGVPATVNLSRSAVMEVAPAMPNFN